MKKKKKKKKRASDVGKKEEEKKMGEDTALGAKGEAQKQYLKGDVL